MNIEFKKWEDLSPTLLHNLLALRINIFIVEQNCPYPELDGKDLNAHHLIVTEHENLVIGTARILAPGVSYKEVSIGRVAIEQSYRSNGLGHKLMKECLQFIEQKYPGSAIRISAQEHLQAYYNKHGFRTVSETYLEDDIPHVEMLKI